jgi:hypothetical protein
MDKIGVGLFAVNEANTNPTPVGIVLVYKLPSQVARRNPEVDHYDIFVVDLITTLSIQRSRYISSI